MRSILVRAFEIMRTRVLWATRFHSVGARSTVGSCRLTRNPKSVSISHHTRLSNDWSLVDLDASVGTGAPKIKIGAYCVILHDFQCNARLSVEIQDYVLIAPRVFVTD